MTLIDRRSLVTRLPLFGLSWVAFSGLATPAFSQNANPVALPLVVSSPDGNVHFTLTQDNDGRVFYGVDRAGKAIIAPSSLGFLFTDQPKFEKSLRLVNPRSFANQSSWEQPWGERRIINDHHQGLMVDLVENIPPHRHISLEVRVFNDGLGFRYLFDGAGSWANVHIADELTNFDIAQEGDGWWINAGEWNRYEYLYQKTPIAALGQAHTPLTMRLDDGTHISIHEAALIDYSAMWLRRVEGKKLRATLSPAADGPKVTRQGPFSTPWRTIQISPDAKGLGNCDLILNLNEPNKLGDVSWVKPGKYVGIWWGMHLGRQTWGPGPHHGATTQNAINMMDFAADHGFDGVLVEGWNKGWSDDWALGESHFSFTEAYPDFDIAAVCAYGHQKNVRLIGHHETAANIANYEPQMENAFAFYEQLGVSQVKTGYVADFFHVRAPNPKAGEAGQPDIIFATHDGQIMVRHHLRLLEAAAAHKISIDSHEPVKDTGLRRTYPNWLTREGARGQEYNAWGSPTNPPEHEATLAFTRMLAGPMDFTPGIFHLKPTLGTNQVKSTLAKQLALYVVLYSPIQMAADLPEYYLARPDAFQFIKDVVTDWDETIFLDGAIGEHVAVARRGRHSDIWFLGAISGANAKRQALSFDFLPEGKRYIAEIYKDGPHANWQEKPDDLTIERREITRASRLSVQMAAGGGVAIRLVPLGSSA